MERFFISPAQHQIHHSNEARHHDKNFGSALALWDLIGGTLYIPKRREVLSFGLSKTELNHANNLLSAWFHPLAAALRAILRTRKVRAATTANLLTLALLADTSAVSAEHEEVIEITATAEPKAPEEVPEPPTAPSPSGIPQQQATKTTPYPRRNERPKVDHDREVIVLGTRAARASGSVQVFNEKHLSRMEHDDAHQILLAAPGVYLRGEDGFGLRPNIGIRGASSDRSKKVTLLEDGILFAPAPYSAPAAYYFPLVTRMSSVRVIKGPSSIPYGPQSIGGAIDLRTRQFPAAAAGHVDAAAGSFGYGKVHAWGGINRDRSGLLLEGVHLRSDGYKDLDGGGDTGFYRNEWMVKGRYLLDPTAPVSQEFQVKAGYSDELSNETYTGLTDADFRQSPWRRYRITSQDQMQWRRTSLSLRHLTTFSPKLSLETTAYRNDLDRSWTRAHGFVGSDFASVLNSPAGRRRVFYEVMTGNQDSATNDEDILVGPNRRVFVSQGIQTIARLKGRTGSLFHSAEYGVRFHHDSVRRKHLRSTFEMVSEKLRPKPLPQATNADNAASTHAVAFHATDAITYRGLTVTPGIRLELIRWQYRDSQQGRSQADGYAVALPGLGLYQELVGGLGALAGVYRGFSPTAPNLDAAEAETSWNYEAGLRYSKSRTRLELIGFLNDYENLTDVCTFSNGCLNSDLDRQFDAGSVRVYGVELFARHEFSLGAFRVPTTATYTYSDSRFGNSFVSADPLWGEVKRGDQLPSIYRAIRPKRASVLRLKAGV